MFVKLFINPAVGAETFTEAAASRVIKMIPIEIYDLQIRIFDQDLHICNDIIL